MRLRHVAQWLLTCVISGSLVVGMAGRKAVEKERSADNTKQPNSDSSSKKTSVFPTANNRAPVESAVIPSPVVPLPETVESKGSCACQAWTLVAEHSLPAVVNIIATHQAPEAKESGAERMIPQVPPGSLFEELFRDFLDRGEQRVPRKVQSAGSGFIIKADEKEAFVVTNAHVVSETKSIKVTLSDKTELDAKLVASDDRSDIAILKFALKPGLKIVALPWGNSDVLKVAQAVMAIGNPFGFGSTVTTGIVSYKGRYLHNGAQQDFEFIQHSAQINMGNSGGCLLNEKGEVIGINTAIITPNAGNVGIGFAIPSTDAKKVVEQLLKSGKIRRGYLGIKIQPISEEMRAGMGLKKGEGEIIVGSISDDGPAKGILEVGDVVLEFDGKKIDDYFQLPRVVAATEIGRKVSIIVLRQKAGSSGPGTYKKITASIRVGELPKEVEAEIAGKEASSSKKGGVVEALGLRIRPLDPETKKEMERVRHKAVHGIVVDHVYRQSRSAEFPILLKKGDVIETAHGKPMHQPDDFLKAIEKAKKDKYDYVLLYVSRSGEDARFLPLSLKSKKSDFDEEKELDKPGSSR